MGSIVVSSMRRVVTASLGRLYDIREGIFVTVAIGVGILLAFGLCSPAQASTIAIAGISVYFATIMIDPLKGLALWMVTQPVLGRYFNISLGAGIPDLSPTRLCIALIIVLLLARATINYRRLLPVSKFDALAFLFMMGMLQAGPRGLHGVSTLQGIFDLYWVPVLTYFAVKNLVTSRQSVHLVLYAVLLVALYSAVYAIYETTTGNVLFTSRVYKYYFYVDSGLRILRGIWGGNVGFGRVFVMAIPILFYFYLKTTLSSQRFLLAICLALVFGGLYLTYKRIAWIAMVVVMFVMQLFYPRFRRLFIFLFIIVAIASALNWDRINTNTVYTDRINSQYSTQEGRTKGWEHALEFWSTRPLLGHGFRQYRNLARAAGYRDQAIESEYLDILVSAGLVGFLPYIGLLLLMGYDGLQIYRGRVTDSLADRDLAAVFLGTLTGYAVTLSTSIVTNLLIHPLLFAVAGAVIYARRETVSTQPEIEQEDANLIPRLGYRR